MVRECTLTLAAKAGKILRKSFWSKLVRPGFSIYIIILLRFQNKFDLQNLPTCFLCDHVTRLSTEFRMKDSPLYKKWNNHKNRKRGLSFIFIASGKVEPQHISDILVLQIVNMYRIYLASSLNFQRNI